MKTVKIKKYKIMHWAFYLKHLLKASKQTWNATGMKVQSLYEMGIIFAPEELFTTIQEAQLYCAAAINEIKAGEYYDLEYDAKNDVIRLKEIKLQGKVRRVKTKP